MSDTLHLRGHFFSAFFFTCQFKLQTLVAAAEKIEQQAQKQYCIAAHLASTHIAPENDRAQLRLAPALVSVKLARGEIQGAVNLRPPSPLN